MEILSTGGIGEEHPDPNRPKNNYVKLQYINYTDVAATPDGDIVFHAKSHDMVPETSWRNNKDCLENALEEAFTQLLLIRINLQEKGYAIRGSLALYMEKQLEMVNLIYL